MSTAIILQIIAGLLGLGLFIGGVFVLAGPGWSLIAAATSCFCVFEFLRKGLTGE
ncbi:hypothetical protein [Pseudomonas sp. PDM13]|uniref:hypothetical protein n=1 Tax=Pseudomonas sp. PDM13 TaxID=2769255 RepID=UPI0021E00326|nr:hypothetical protein [Pseudomonas sp. PDM13]MCU9947510.1 hypothetical protein [Pseudomonas sp. PDM13]